MKNPFKKASKSVAVQKFDGSFDRDQMVLVRDAMDAVNQNYLRANQGRQGSYGGLANDLSGAGGLSDKSRYFRFVPFWINDYHFIEQVTNQSWLAERFIDMPVDDMFAKKRVYEDDAFKKMSDKVRVDEKVSSAMKLSRKYGTAFLWAVTKEANPITPLRIGSVRRGDLVNCIAIDRTDCVIKAINRNPMSPNFNLPEIYTLIIKDHGMVDVHYTRLFRFDGQKAESVNGWKGFEPEWGVSALAPVMNEIFNDTSVTEAITQLVQEASIPVHKVDGLNEIMCRGKLPDEPDVEEIMTAVNMYKSIYRTMFMDGEDTFERTSVNFANIPELMLQFEERFAMASGISVTRFLGKGASGLNATGEGDQRNDSKSTRIRQTHNLEPFYDWIDPIIAKSAGTSAPDYIFPPLYDMSEIELAKVDLDRGRTAKLMVDIGSWSPEESKQYLTTGATPKGPLSPDAERQQVGAGTGAQDPEAEKENEVSKEEKTNA